MRQLLSPVHYVSKNDPDDVENGMGRYGLQSKALPQINKGVQESDDRNGHEPPDALIKVPEPENDRSGDQGENQARPAEPFLKTRQREDPPQFLRKAALKQGGQNPQENQMGVGKQFPHVDASGRRARQ